MKYCKYFLQINKFKFHHFSTLPKEMKTQSFALDDSVPIGIGHPALSLLLMQLLPLIICPQVMMMMMIDNHAVFKL